MVRADLTPETDGSYNSRSPVCGSSTPLKLQYSEMEIGGSEVQGQPRLQRPFPKKKKKNPVF